MDSILNVASSHDQSGSNTIVMKMARGTEIRKIASAVPAMCILFAIFIQGSLIGYLSITAVHACMTNKTHATGEASRSTSGCRTAHHLQLYTDCNRRRVFHLDEDEVPTIETSLNGSSKRSREYCSSCTAESVCRPGEPCWPMWLSR